MSPSRNTRQRKPSHFGSYCHSGPTGTSSTDKASIGGNGGRNALTIIPYNANGQLFSRPSQENFRAIGRSDRGGDPLLELLLRRGADLARGELAVLEDHQRRDRH